MTCFSFGLCQPRLLTIGEKLFSDLFLFNLDRNKTQGQSRKNLEEKKRSSVLSPFVYKTSN